MAQTSGLFFERALLPDGWRENVCLTFDGGRIADVAVGDPARGNCERYAIGLPGMPNLHSHAFQRAMAGLAERRGPGRDDFWTWRDLMYRLAQRMDPDGLRIVAALSQIEMLESGFTQVGEFHYLHHDADGRPFADVAEMSAAIFAAAGDTGIGLTHLPVFYAHAGFGGRPPEAEQRRFVSDLDLYARLLDACRDHARTLPDAVVGIAPHSLRAVTARELDALVPLAGRDPIHIHVAEQVREVEECRAETGTTPVRWLLDHAKLSPQWCLIHATHIDDMEIRGIAQAKAVVGLCPITEANLGDGIFPGRSFAEAGGIYGIGSDSNVRIDMAEELRLLEYGQRLSSRSRMVLATAKAPSTGRNLFESALKGGAQALGRAAGLEPGASADIVSLRADHIAFAGRTEDDWLDSLVFAASTGAIDRVWRNGRLVVADGRHLDRERIEHEFCRALPGLLE